MEDLKERYENCVDEMQDLAKSMEKTIRQHQEKPERVCRDNSLKILIKKTQNLLDEMNDCQNGMDELTQDLINEKTENEREIQICNAKIDQTYEDIDYRIDAIQDKEREISESEDLVSSLERALRQGQQANENRREAMEVTKGITFGSYIGGAALAVGGVFMPILLIPAAAALTTSVGTAVAHKSYKDQGEVDVGEIRNRLQNQRWEKSNLEEKNEQLREEIENDRIEIVELNEKLDECENSIEDYRKSISAMTLCKKILTEWLLFLQDLEQSMNRIESYGSNYAAIKDTAAFNDYLTFIESHHSNQILKTSTQIQALEYMDENDLKHMLTWNDECESDAEDSDKNDNSDDECESTSDSDSDDETDSSSATSNSDSTENSDDDSDSEDEDHSDNTATDSDYLDNSDNDEDSDDKDSSDEDDDNRN